jgi:hypothetical protein
MRISTVLFAFLYLLPSFAASELLDFSGLIAATDILISTLAQDHTSGLAETTYLHGLSGVWNFQQEHVDIAACYASRCAANLLSMEMCISNCDLDTAKRLNTVFIFLAISVHSDSFFADRQVPKTKHLRYYFAEEYDLWEFNYVLRVVMQMLRYDVNVYYPSEAPDPRLSGQQGTASSEYSTLGSAE